MKQNGSTNTAHSGAALSAADRLGALAEPLRLRLLRLLENRELTVGELAKVLQTPQSTVSRHLKVLSQAGWLSRRSEGTATMYQLLLDELDREARPLWLAVREQTSSPEQAEQDARRLEAVLDERRLDSRSFFGRVAGEWDEVRREMFGRGFTPVALLGLLDPSWTVADLGCGTGNAAEHLAPFVKRVIAVDQSPPMLEAAHKRLSRFDNIEFRTGDLNALPIEDASADATVTTLVLHHIEDPTNALAETHRVLKPGGVALIVDMAAHDRTDFRRTMGHKHLGFSLEDITEHLKGAGFGDIHVHPLPSHPDAKGPGLFVATGRKPKP